MRGNLKGRHLQGPKRRQKRIGSHFAGSMLSQRSVRHIASFCKIQVASTLTGVKIESIEADEFRMMTFADQCFFWSV